MSQNIVFAGLDAGGKRGLWISNGSPGGTFELNVVGASAAVSIRRILRNSATMSCSPHRCGGPRWPLEHGTARPRAHSRSIRRMRWRAAEPEDFLSFNGKLLFDGTDAAGHVGLWQTDGTAAGTTEIAVANALRSGSHRPISRNSTARRFSPDTTRWDQRSVEDRRHLRRHSRARRQWRSRDRPCAERSRSAQRQALLQRHRPERQFRPVVDDGRRPARSSSSAAQAPKSPCWTRMTTPPSSTASIRASWTVFNGKLFFDAADPGGHNNLWVSDGTAAGTHEVAGRVGYIYGLVPTDFHQIGNELMFAGNDFAGHRGLWDRRDLRGHDRAERAGAGASGLDPSGFASSTARCCSPGRTRAAISGYADRLGGTAGRPRTN